MKLRLVALIILISFVLSACQQATAVPAKLIPTEISQPTNTATIQPSATFSATPKPTNTAIPPTPTVEPPSVAIDYLTNVKVTEIMTFNTDPYLDLNTDLVKIKDGEMVMVGDGYQGGAEGRVGYKEGKGVIFDFSITPGESDTAFEFETFFANGEWWTPGYRRFGVYIVPAPQADMWVGTKGTGKNLTGNLVIVPGNTYKLLMAIGDKADFLCVIWDPNNPEKIRKYRIPKGGDWTGMNWKFTINGAYGEMWVDNLITFTFDGYK